jgi:ADP-heptose:LPS heptosyltransferase
MMTPEYYRDKWHVCRERADADDAHRISQEVALTFLDRYFFNDRFEDGYVQLLCDMATTSNEALCKPASSALFGIIVESLCDDFEELQTEAYNRLMSLILTHCRAWPGGEDLDDRMTRFGLSGFDACHARAERLRKTSCNFRQLPYDVKKVLFLSRVTIGADVALTSVLIQRFADCYPNAEMVIVGGGKVGDITAGNPNIRVHEVDYVRRGDLLTRLKSWFDVLEAIDDEVGHLSPEEILIVDPDSRLSQLGVLPLVDDASYLFFNSRGSNSYDQKMSVSEMANQWCDQVAGDGYFRYPTVWLDSELTTAAKRVVDGMYEKGCRKIVFVNFGVGGNARKRIEGDFEMATLLALLEEPNTVIILDRGFGDEELQRTDALLRAVKNEGYQVGMNNFCDLEMAPMGAGVIGVRAGIDEAAALIGACDEFIGYDSACQHLAAAMEVPAYTIFAGSNNTRFVRRWRPFGPGRTEIIHVDTLSHPPVFDTHTIVLRLLHARENQ